MRPGGYLKYISEKYEYGYFSEMGISGLYKIPKFDKGNKPLFCIFKNQIRAQMLIFSESVNRKADAGEQQRTKVSLISAADF